jgi:NitT/TauT family transport system permease protein
MTALTSRLPGRHGPRLSLRGRRWLDPAPVISLVAVLVVWQIAAGFTSDTVIPGLPDVVSGMWQILTGEGLQDFLFTLARVGVGLVTAFAVGTALGILSGALPTFGRYVLPVVRFVQGIPSLSWVVIAVIWFKSVEVRIWFIMLIVTLPGFTLQLYDSYRAIPNDLRDMARSFRPSGGAMLREVTLPAVMPGIFTAWKINLGLGIRMVLVAELVGATIGVGAQLLQAQQLFDMTAVVAWTLLLALAVLLAQGIIELIEARVLRYRPPVGDRAIAAAAAARERRLA